MAETKFINLYTKLNEILIEASSQLRNAAPDGYAFDGRVASYQEIYDLLDRTDLIEKLRKLAQEQNVTAGKWIKLKMQLDYMASTERDLRQRYRSRLDNYRTGASSKQFMALTLRELLLEIETMTE